MPFDYEAYAQKCSTMTVDQLQLEWENYTRQLAGGATSTGCAVLFSPVTAGISLVGLGLSAPRVHNARKKRDIVEKYLVMQGATHITRKRDVALPAAISGALGTVTLGLAGPGADMLGGIAAEKGAEYLVSHVALDSAGAALEHQHGKHEKTKADHKRGGPKTGVPHGQVVFTQEQIAQGKVPGLDGQQQQFHGQQQVQVQQLYQQQYQQQTPQVQQPYQLPNQVHQQTMPQQQQQYETVAVPPSYQSSQQHPQQPSTPSQGNGSSPSAFQAPQYQPQILQPQNQPQQQFQQPEKQLYVVGNPEAGQPFGLQSQGYPPEKTAAYAPQPQPNQQQYVPEQTFYATHPQQTQQQVSQPGKRQEQSTPAPVQAEQPQRDITPSQTPAPWSYDFNQWTAQEQQGNQSQTATQIQPGASQQSQSQADQNLVPQPLFASTPQLNQVIAAPQPVQANQEASIQVLETSRPAPTPIQPYSEGQHQSAPSEQTGQQVPPPLPATRPYNQPPQASQQQQYIPNPPSSSSPQTYGAPQSQGPPPQNSYTPVSPQQPQDYQVQSQQQQGHPRSDSIISNMSALSLQSSQSQNSPTNQQQQPQQYQQQYQAPPQQYTPPQQQYQPPQLQQQYQTQQQPQQQQYQPSQQLQQQYTTPQQQYQFPPPPQQPQQQYQPQAYRPTPSPRPQSVYLPPPPPSTLHPGSTPQAAGAKPARPTSMLASLGSSLATSISTMAANAASRSSTPQPTPALTPSSTGTSWSGPPSIMSPPPGYASPAPGIMSPGGQYEYVSPPPAYASPANGGAMLQSKDYFGTGMVGGQVVQGQSQGQWGAGGNGGPAPAFTGQQQPQQQQVPIMGNVQYYSAPPPAGQWVG